MKKFTGSALAVAGVCVIGTSALADGKLVVSFDDHMLSDRAFGEVGQPALFARNLASMFTDPSEPGQFLAYSSSAGLTGSQLAGVMMDEGHAWTATTTHDFTLEALGGYDAIFLGGDAVPDLGVILDYLETGGNVYLMGGTGRFGSAFGEANYWAPLLSNFDLSFSVGYDAIYRTVNVASDHQLLSGVSSLYQRGGQALYDLNPDDNNKIVGTAFGQNAFAIAQSNVIPAPGSAAFGTVLLAGFARRRRRLIG